MRKAPLYCAILISTYVVIAAVTFYFAVTTPPYVGDLTRLGGYREDEYGWREPQQRYASPLVSLSFPPAGADVVVLGDSMSLHSDGEQTDPGAYWPNWLAARTGWTIAAFHRRDFNAEEIMAMPAYQRHPPKVFVLEFAERSLSSAERLLGEAVLRSRSSQAQSPAFPALSRPAPLAATPQSYPYPAPVHSAVDWSVGGHRLKHLLLRAMMPSAIETVRYPLVRADLFSSQRPDRLLVYRDDLQKLSLQPADWEREGRALRALQASVEADGRTRLVVLVVPDKLSAYAPYVQGLPQPYPLSIERLSPASGLAIPRMDQIFAQMLRQGARDLYLPNDTHLGYQGHAAIAQTLLDDWTARGWVTP